MRSYGLITIGGGHKFSPYANLLVMNLATGQVVEEFKLKHQVYEQSTKGFTGGHIATDGTLWVTTEAEILQFRLNPLELLQRVSYRYLNDVHHLYVDSECNRILVCNTGLDAIEVYSMNFDHIQSISLTQNRKYLKRAIKSLLINKPRRRLRDFLLRSNRMFRSHIEELWAEDMRYKHLTDNVLLADIYKAFWPGQLYRSKRDLRYVVFRPHILHPNFTWKVGNNYLITLKNTGEVITLENHVTLISGLKAPHDGILSHSTYLLTEAGGGWLSYSRPVNSVDDLCNAQLQRIQVCNPKEGFIRGVDLLSEDKAVAAISKRREITDNRPAYLSLIDLGREQCSARVNLPLKYGTNPFSILDVTKFYN